MPTTYDPSPSPEVTPTGGDGSTSPSGGNTSPSGGSTPTSGTPSSGTPTATLSTGMASVSRLIPAGALRADREYVVQTYFRKKIHRGGHGGTQPPAPLDLEENFLWNVYPQLYVNRPNYVDPQIPGYDLELSNQLTGPTAGAFFNAYRASTDFYFPTLGLPGKPLLDTGTNVLPVTLYEETLTEPNGGAISEMLLSYRALEPPVFILNGQVLSQSNFDYQAVYAPGHPLAWQHYHLQQVSSPTSVLIARYRTARQPLVEYADDYGLNGQQPVYVDVDNAQAVPPNTRMFFTGTATGNPPNAIGFVLSKYPLASSTTITQNGNPVANALRTSLSLTSGATLTLPGVYWLLIQGNMPAASDTFRITYGVLDATQPDVISPSLTAWDLKWSVPDRYPPGLLGVRVNHQLIVEAAPGMDFAFTKTRTLATLSLLDLNGTNLATTIDLMSAAGGAFTDGGTYLVRVRSHKVVSLINGTTLIRDAYSDAYRFELAGTSSGLIDFYEPDVTNSDFH